MRARRSILPVALAAMPVMYLAICSCSGKDGAASSDSPDHSSVTTAAPGEAIALIEKGYEHKRVGMNGAALEAFDKACAMMEKAGVEGSAAYGSCLDDKASVMLRMGRTEEARGLYIRAMKVMKGAPAADPRLIAGIGKRLEIIDAMKEKGFECKEPAVPDDASPLPYFADVAEMQEALGKLNPLAASCNTGVPEAVTLRIEITGDGIPLRAEARGPMADSDLGKCVVEKITAAIPTAELPRFRACFRGFTYPYMVGTHK